MKNYGIDWERYQRMEEALWQIKKWVGAYPVEIFPEPDVLAAREKLGEDLMAALHASWARHILKGVAKYARDGLREDDEDT